MQIKGVSVENTLDLVVFGDILVWVATCLGLVPWDKLFNRKKDFQELLAELSDGPNVFFGDDIVLLGDDGRIGMGGRGGSEAYPGKHSSQPTERVCGPWGVVPYKYRIGRRL